MNKITNRILTSLKYRYLRYKGIDMHESLRYVNSDADDVSERIYNLLMSDKPCMIARYGSTELGRIVTYLSSQKKQHSVLKYIKGEEPEWWWTEESINLIQKWSGFFPANVETISRFSEMMLQDTKDLDMLGSWVSSERYIEDRLIGVDIVHLRLLEPFWASQKWTRALKGKKVLVIHPFADLIKYQYENNREKLFLDPDILPKFDLTVIQAVQSLGGDNEQFSNWFEALEWMKSEMDKINYDIAIIGCGAYGFPLAAHAKRTGHKGVHIGGVLQLLFGIIGNRWLDPNYGVKEWGIPVGSYSNLVNDYWVRPGQKERPKNAKEVEGACYW